MPSRPWPRIVRGRTIVTSSPAATASWHSSSACELGPAVGLERPARRVLGDRVVLGDAEDRARRRVHDLARRRASRAATQHVGGAADVDRLEQLAVLGQRHLGDVVEARRRRPSHARAHARRGRGRRPATNSTPAASASGGLRSKMRTASPRRERLLGEHGAEVAAAAGDEDRARPSELRRRARGTSARSRACRRAASIGGLVAELVRAPGEMSQAIVSFSSPSTCSACT